MLNEEVKHNTRVVKNTNEENNRWIEVKGMPEELLTRNKIRISDHPINPMKCFVGSEK